MTTRSLLLTELEFICRNCARLVAQVDPAQRNYRPAAADGVQVRSLLDLANHLAQVPSLDLAILRGMEEADIDRLERELWRDDPQELRGVIRDGYEELLRFMEKMSVSEFETGNASAYYGRTQTYAQWLLEIITHLYHHRAQTFTYLKLSGAPVDTKSLYSNG